MITLKNISKKYGQEKIINDLSLNIPRSSIFGFLGPNGAGKTTTMKMLVGISQPTKGEIKIGNKPINDIKKRVYIGYMPEDPYFYDHLTAKEFLEFMANLDASSTPVIPAKAGIQKKITGSQIKSGMTCDINNLLSIVNLSDSANSPIVNFSKGMKQRLGLAQALIGNPEYIFLDEPLDGLDPIGRREFKKIILDLKKQGKTIFFNSHVLSDVEEICDQIGIINKGKLIYAGDIKKFSGKQTLEDAFVNKILKIS